jgi:hypothetical protein
MYFSAVWEEKAVYADVYNAWKKFLADKYGFSGQIFCAGGQKLPGFDLAKAKADQLSMRQHWQTQGKKIVETGWTTLMPGAKPASQGAASAQGAAPPGATPVAAGSPMYWGACHLARLQSGRGPTGGWHEYFSDVFPTDLMTAEGVAYRAHVAAVTKAFGELVSSKYGRERDNPWCSVMTSEAKLRVIYQGWIDEAKKTGKVVMTGWKYTAK